MSKEEIENIIDRISRDLWILSASVLLVIGYEWAWVMVGIYILALIEKRNNSLNRDM